MATQTSNLGLTKPAYSETADIADINNNMDKVDAAVNGVQNGMAILANGNVHSAVTSGQYVYVRNHGTLAEGLYTATTNISTNATLSTSNLTAVPNNGALNTLRDDVTSLNSKLAKSYPIEVSLHLNESVDISANSVGTVFSGLDVVESSLTDSINNKTLATLLSGLELLGCVSIYATGVALIPDTLVYKSSGKSLLSIRYYNPTANTITVYDVRLILFVRSV